MEQNLSGLLDADITVKGTMSAMEKHDFEHFSAGGAVNLQQFYYASKDYPDGVSLQTLKALFNPKSITLSQPRWAIHENEFQSKWVH